MMTRLNKYKSDKREDCFKLKLDWAWAKNQKIKNVLNLNDNQYECFLQLIKTSKRDDYKAKELCKTVQPKLDSGISISTVERNLRLFRKAGLFTKDVPIKPDPSRFRNFLFNFGERVTGFMRDIE